MMKRLLAAVLSILVSLSLYLVPSVSLAQTPQMYKFSYMFFGTFDTAITIIGFAESQEKFDGIAAQAENRFQQLHRLYNQYQPYEGINNMYYVNRNAAKGPVNIDKDLFDLLSWAKERQRETRGKVNIALGAVLALWHDERENAESDPDKAALPPMAALEEANRHTNIDDLVLDEANRTAFFTDPLLKLDLGAVAKGYAAEVVARMLLDSEMTSFIINAGGNVRTGHPPLDGRSSWGIGIQDPDAAIVLPGNDDIMDVLYLSDCSLVTSGDYQRYFIVDGKRYHHLISPDTLYPADFMRSVTIITRDSAYADLLSTAVFLMPYGEGRAFVESLEGVDALWVLNDRSVKMTDGAAKVAKSMGYLP